MNDRYRLKEKMYQKIKYWYVNDRGAKRFTLVIAK